MISKLKQTPPPPERVITPQCTTVVPANTHFETWRKGRYADLRPHTDPARCQRESVVEIDGKPYCTLHGGKVALAKWLKGELVEKVQA
ncbi:hypothetical protein [Bradyrhizobium sp.]|jgi:endogenous inhibitor of DNA gyrase (YacG/DUF329 family)|uniref:hypothetical protein n=1 Tax=Bradyrhizobium sp. TaxID=376 RepID=UPI002DDC8FBD|nr:hypothetical protein [Bradyrhizobium sp.]HEV2155432.1 hypothetical protein [Bradyrhizobium sp.]